MFEFEGFRFLEQLLIPAISGGIGGMALVVMASLNDVGAVVFKKIFAIYVKFIFLGVIAGIAAVNLLNPKGDISQVMVLGLIAGLSAFSYLKRTALVDNLHDDLLLKAMKEAAVSDAKLAGFTESPDESFDFLLEEEVDQDLVDRFINIKMSDWIDRNPDATDEQLDAYLNSLIEDVIENPDLVKLDENEE